MCISGSSIVPAIPSILSPSPLPFPFSPSLSAPLSPPNTSFTRSTNGKRHGHGSKPKGWRCTPMTRYPYPPTYPPLYYTPTLTPITRSHKPRHRAFRKTRLTGRDGTTTTTTTTAIAAMTTVPPPTARCIPTVITTTSTTGFATSISTATITRPCRT